MILASAFSHPEVYAVPIAAFIGAVYVALKKFGVLADRQPSIEPRAEQMWRSEAEAQAARASRLEHDLEKVSHKLDDALTMIGSLRAEIRVLQERPDYGTMLARFDQHHQSMVETSTVFMSAMQEITNTLRAISIAVIPPDVIREG